MFSIADTGPGVAPERRERIFEEFEQGDLSGRSEGTGLGLAITKRLIELMGGKIALADNPGGGSVFSFIGQPAGADFGRAGGARRGGEGAAAGPSRAGRRQFAVRGAGAGGATRRGRRLDLARRRARGGAGGAGGAPGARHRHRRLRARAGGDARALGGGARRRGRQEPGAVFAVRAARVRRARGVGVRRLAGQAGAGALAVRAAGGGISVAGRGRAGVPAARPAIRARALVAEDNDINFVIAPEGPAPARLRGRAGERRA